MDSLREAHVLERAKGVRRIRNFDITDYEIKRLLAAEKLDATTVNAVSAKIQADAEAAGDSPDWCIFSSWLGPLVSGMRKEGPGYGTISEHIKSATPDGQVHTLLARTTWAIPLCSFKKPTHWILAWIDFGRGHISFFDSIPELGSTSWAEPLFLQVMDTIFFHIGKPAVQWDDGSWTRQLYSPSPLQRQMDGWSCGLFVLMAISAIGRPEILEKVVGHDKVDEMRVKAIEIILTIPITRMPPEAGVSGDEGDIIEIPNPTITQTSSINHINNLSLSENLTTIAPASSSMVIDQPNTEDAAQSSVIIAKQTVKDLKEKQSIASSSKSVIPKKRSVRANISEDESDGQLSENEKKRVKRAAATQQALKGRSKLKPDQRRINLEQDKWISTGSVKPDKVKCSGCSSIVKLSNRPGREYEWKNWGSHKDSCPQITGSEVIRTAKMVDNLGKTTYITKKVSATPSIRNFFSVGPMTPTQPLQVGPTKEPVKDPAPTLCKNLSGPGYADYIDLITTREFGGISSAFIARVARQIFPYKPFPVLKEPKAGTKFHSFDIGIELPATATSTVPPDGNANVAINYWTDRECRNMERIMKHWARWRVDFSNKCVVSTACDGTTRNTDGICDGCREVSKDESLKRSIRRKRHEASLSVEERQMKIERRGTLALADTINCLDKKSLKRKIEDPVIFNIKDSMKKGEPSDCFLALYTLACEGKLKNYERFTDVCMALEDRIVRENSSNPNDKYGIRYTEDYMQFMIVMRGFGQNSNRNYDIFSAAFGGPDVRTIRTAAKKIDTLKNPSLIFENIARVKRYVDSVKYLGPIIIGSDNTKVRKRLNFSTDHGAHVLGTIFDLDAVEVENADDIDEIVDRVAKQKAFASQARAIIAKIPLPQCPPIVISLLPTNGSESADDIHLQHMKLQKMAAQLTLPVVVLAADGAASELSAQAQMDNMQSELPPLTYEFPLYGIYLQAPVFKDTGPLISVTDPPHGRKTARNQPQYGTHTASLGIGYLVNNSFVELQKIDGSGLVIRDVETVDKQDDGAARRIFHSTALSATCFKDVENGNFSIRPGFEGLFVYLFIMGSLFEAWMNPAMPLNERVISALRARFWLHYWREHIANLTAKFPDLYSLAKSFISPASFHIFNRLCDTLVLLALAYAKYYPDQPFCPWLIDTGFVEHFFGIARQILPNFSYAEFIKMAQHIMIRQRILESGLIKTRRDRNSAVGYVYNPASDMREASKSEDNAVLPPSNLTKETLNALVKIAHDEVVRISRDILHLPVPPLSPERPIKLHPLGATKKSAKGKKKSSTEHEKRISDSESESDLEEPEDSDDELDSDSETEDEPENATKSIDDAAALASSSAARYSALSQTLDATIQDHNLSQTDLALPLSHALPKPTALPNAIPEAQKSQLVDKATSKASIKQIVEARIQSQSGTVVKSERTFVVSEKYEALQKIRDAEEVGKAERKAKRMKAQEAAQRLRIAQDTNDVLKKQEQKKTRQLRWQSAADQLAKELKQIVKDVPHLSERGVTALNGVRKGTYLIMRSQLRYYIGEVLDLYQKGQNSRYGSVEFADSLKNLSYLSLRVFLALENCNGKTGDGDSDDDSDEDAEDSDEVPDFSCTMTRLQYHLHTHAPVENVVYNLGTRALTGPDSKKSLTQLAASRWKVFAQSKVKKVIKKAAPPLKIRVPGGNFGKK